MFGLMKISRHEARLNKIRSNLTSETPSRFDENRRVEDLARDTRTERDLLRSRVTRRDTRIATLETDLAAANEKLRHAEAELAAVKKPARKPDPKRPDGWSSTPIMVSSDPAGMKVAAKNLATRMKATGETIGEVGVVAEVRAPKKGT